MSASSVAVHTPDYIYSAKHLPSWFALAFAAGGVNAAAFLATERFVSAVTGTLTKPGVTGATQVLIEALVIAVAFILGAVASVVPLQARRAKGLTPMFHAPLIGVGLILAGVALAGASGVFGDFGATTYGSTTVLLALLAFSMGLQNAAVASTTNNAVRTTHVTGTATDLGVNLGTAAVANGEERKAALRGAGLRAGKMISFAGGAAAMVPLAIYLRWWSLLAPAIIVALCALESFAPFSHPRANPVTER